MKNDQYDINTKENLRAYTGVVGSIQRNFGLEVSQFMENKRKNFIERTGKTPANGGDRANSFGRSMELAAMYNEAAQESNLRRADIKQGEDLRGAQRTLQSKQSQEIGKRGFEPIPDEPPVKPKGESYLTQALNIANTAASFIHPVQSIGKAAGIGLGGSGFLTRFFQG